MTIPLVTVDEVKDFIKTKSTFTGNDAIYLSLATKATKLIEQYCRRTFDKKEYIEFFGTRKAGRVILDLYGATQQGYLEQNETQKFYLSNTPIDTLADFEVFFDPQRVWDEDSKLSESIYWLDTKAGVLSISTYVGATEHSVKVVYTAGYDVVNDTLSESAPEDLKLACLVTVVNLFNRMQDRTFGLRQSGEDDHAPDFSHYGMVPPEAREIILPYRKTFVGRK